MHRDNLNKLIELIEDKRLLLKNLSVIENNSQLTKEVYVREKQSILNTLSKVNHLIKNYENSLFSGENLYNNPDWEELFV